VTLQKTKTKIASNERRDRFRDENWFCSGALYGRQFSPRVTAPDLQPRVKTEIQKQDGGRKARRYKSLKSRL
jgi:hypothetical protein